MMYMMELPRFTGKLGAGGRMGRMGDSAALGRNPTAVLGAQFAGAITGLVPDRKAEFMRAGLLSTQGRMDVSRPRVIRG
jgi:hypothetical protein